MSTVSARFILKALIFVFSGFFRFIVYSIPRDRALWVFGCNNGQQYADNSKYLFEWVLENKHEIRCHWITKSRKIESDLKQRGIPCSYAYSLSGLAICMRSGVWLFDHTSSDINRWLSFGASKVNLWHGSPLKKIMFDHELVTGKRFFLRHILQRINLPGAFDRPDIFVTASKTVAEIMVGAWRLNEEVVKITGYPRNDALFLSYDKHALYDSHGIDLYRYDKLVIYMPTFRKDMDASSAIDWKALQGFLSKENIALLVKKHPYDIDDHGGVSLPNVYFIEKELDVYPILAVMDALVTDYSSVAFDYMLLDRPIIYHAYDLDEYLSDDRSMYRSFESIAAGAITRNTRELIDAIRSEIVIGKDEYRATRNRICVKYNAFCDGLSCRRVFDAVVDSVLYR